MSLKIGTAPLGMDVWSGAYDLAGFTVTVPVMADAELPTMTVSNKNHVDVTIPVSLPPEGVLGKAVQAGVTAFKEAFEATINQKEDEK